MAIRAEDLPVSTRQTLAFDVDLLVGNRLARQIDGLNMGPRIDIRAVTTPGSKDNGKLLVSATTGQLMLFNIGAEFRDKAIHNGVSEDRLATIIPDVLRGALGTLTEARQSGMFGEAALSAGINEYLNLQQARYGF